MTNKFAIPTIELGGEVFDLRCNGRALAEIESIFGDVPFTEALAKLVDQLNARTFKIGLIAEVFSAMATNKDGAKPDKSFALEHMESTADTIRIVEAIGKALSLHFPSVGDNTEVGEDAEPGEAKA